MDRDPNPGGGGLDPIDLVQAERERAAQLESYATDLARTYSELRRHLHYMTVLHEVTTRIAAVLDPDVVMEGLLESLEQLLSYRVARLYLFEVGVQRTLAGPGALVPNDAVPHFRAGRGGEHSPSDQPDAVISVDSVVIQAVQTRSTVVRHDPSGEVRMALPCRAGGHVLGALLLVLDQPLSDEHLKIVEMLVAGMSVALQNAYLYQETQRLATTDPLTGLSNYRYFHEVLALEVERARRMGYPVGLLMLDLDHFKAVNDRYGHPAGDLVLRKVADALGTRLRRTDIVARLGGEEFAAILPGAGTHEVTIVAEKIRQTVESLPGIVVDGNGSPSVTVSVGAVSLPPELVDPVSLITYADRALYQAKNQGRNQVCLAVQSVQPDATDLEGASAS